MDVTAGGELSFIPSDVCTGGPSAVGSSDVTRFLLPKIHGL